MKIIITNWKNHPATSEEAKELFIAESQLAEKYSNVKTVICPPEKFLSDLSELKTKNYKLKTILGSQDVFWPSPTSAKANLGGQASSSSYGVRYTLVGHSDRRYPPAGGGDSDEIINQKIKTALATKVVPILLVGEKEKGDKQKAILEEQLTKGLAGLSPEDMDSVLICYEPVWAISTQVASEPDSPQNTLLAGDTINEFLRSMFGSARSGILYGGSVTADNVADFLKHPEIIGAVVGAASLDPAEFAKLLETVSQI